jgi:hypothetical protein
MEQIWTLDHKKKKDKRKETRRKIRNKNII